MTRHSNESKPSEQVILYAKQIGWIISLLPIEDTNYLVGNVAPQRWEIESTLNTLKKNVPGLVRLW